MDIIQHFTKNLKKLTGANWVQLIQANEEFAGKCDWSKLDGGDWAKLLKTHPQFKANIPFEELSDWGRLLPDFPEYAHLCPNDKRTDWADFIAAHPDHPALKDFDFSTLEERDWNSLLKKHPFLVERYPGWDDMSESDFTTAEWALRVAAFPEKFADRCPWDKLNGENWTQILSFQPQFIDRCDWSCLTPSQQAKLLTAQPQFADKCDFSKFDGSNWAALLSERPEFAEQCPFDILNGNDWEGLLCNQPEFADQCDWSKVMAHNWSMLLHIYPEWAEKYNCPFEQFSSWACAELLDHCPQFAFADRCDLAKLEGDELFIVFSRQPTLIREELIPQLKHRLLDFLCDFPEYIAEYAENIPAEEAVREIRNLIFEDYHVWAEVQVMSMFSPEETYIAKAICVNAEKGIYQDIFFRDGGSIVQADADGRSITEAVVRLYSCVRDCWREDFTLDFDPASRKL